jgi:hypothetical protein
MNAANDAERNRIEKIKADNMPNKADTKDQQTWATVFDSTLKTVYAADPEHAEEKAITAANRAIQKGDKRDAPKYPVVASRPA